MTDDRAILTYHSLDHSGSAISLTPGAFERHLDWMLASGTPAGPLEDLALEAPGPALALSFDDGFKNFAAEAWPRLRDRGLSATLFLVPACMGGDNRWQGRDEPGIPSLPLLTWDEVGPMAEEGLRIGCHSLSHPDLRGLAAADLLAETEGAAARIEEVLGVRPTTFCYPFGHADEGARAAVARVFERAVTTRFALLQAGDDRWLLPRIDAYYFEAAGRLESFGSPRFARFVSRRRILRRLRGLLSGPRLL